MEKPNSFFSGAMALGSVALLASTANARTRKTMLSAIEATRRHILLYTLPMIAAAVAPWALGLARWLYGAAAVGLSAAFLILAAAVFANSASDAKQMGPEKRLFAFSILYLFGLFGALVADKWLLA